MRDEKDVGPAQPSLESTVPNVDAAEPPFHTTVTIPPPQRPCTLGSTNQGKEMRKSVVITVCSEKPGQHPGMVQGKRPKGKSATK